MEMEEVKWKMRKFPITQVPISNLPPMAQIAGRPNRKGLGDFAPRCRALGRRLTTPDSMRGAVCGRDGVGPSMHPCILAASNIQSSNPNEGSPQSRGGSGRLWVHLLPSGLSCRLLLPRVSAGVSSCQDLPDPCRPLDLVCIKQKSESRSLPLHTKNCCCYVPQAPVSAHICCCDVALALAKQQTVRELLHPLKLTFHTNAVMNGWF